MLCSCRLFTSSPPSDTFTIANDVVDVDGSQAKRRSRANAPQQTSAQPRGHPPNPNHRPNNPNRNPKLQAHGATGNAGEVNGNVRSKQRQGLSRAPVASALNFGYHPVGGDGESKEEEVVERGEKDTGAVAKPSGLSTMIRLKKDGSGKAMSGPGLSHVIYLPDSSNFNLDIPMKFTVEETIYASLEVSYVGVLFC